MPVCLLEITLAVIYTWQSPPQSQQHMVAASTLTLARQHCCCCCSAALAQQALPASSNWCAGTHRSCHRPPCTPPTMGCVSVLFMQRLSATGSLQQKGLEVVSYPTSCPATVVRMQQQHQGACHRAVLPACEVHSRPCASVQFTLTKMQGWAVPARASCRCRCCRCCGCGCCRCCLDCHCRQSPGLQQSVELRQVFAALMQELPASRAY